jgi:transcriptional regulator with XRE-family HTH domain
MNFLTTGEKIRSLRKRMGMRQQELEDENITRAFISMIETGKRGLSKDTAKLIASKLSKKAQCVGVNLFIDENYLLRTPSEDAEIYCNDKLSNFPTNDEIDVIINIAKTYKLIRVEALANKILGDYSFKGKRNTEAFIYYLICLDLYKETSEKELLPYLYHRLGLCKLNESAYVEAISFFSRSDYYSKIYEGFSIEKDNLYYIALGCKHLGRYNEGLKYIEKYLLICDKKTESNEYARVSILKAHYYAAMGNGNKAIYLLDELIADLHSYKTELNKNIYIEASRLYLSEGHLEKSLSYLQLADNIVDNVDNIDSACVYLLKGKIYLAQKSYEEAALEANNCLRLAFGKDELMLRAYDILIDIYSFKKDFVNLRNTYTKLLELLKDKEGYSEEILKLYNKLALLYLEQNDVEMCKKYLSMVS